MRISISRLPTLFVVILLAVPASARAAGVAPLFSSHETLTISIDAPIDDIRKERDSEEYHDGLLRYTDEAGQAQELNIKLRARGRYRRQPKTCSFPPIRLNFKKKQVDGTVFAGQDKIKLVTHCQNGSEFYEQLLLKEYLTYRLFETMTDLSFRVRLLRITWTDSAQPTDVMQTYGFLLEDEDLLGERLGFEKSNVRSTAPARLIADQGALVGVYQYMIGNTDFSMLLGPTGESCCHNIVLYRTDNDHLPIPYDFDFSGFVNAPYAEPNPKLKIRSVKTRLYRGRCEHNAQLESTLEKFRANRDELFALLDNQEGLDKRTLKTARGYLDDFFKIINDPKKVRSRLIKKCV